jgi:hypothetical protein
MTARYFPVDAQLELFEENLRDALSEQLVMNTNRQYWSEMDRLSDENNMANSLVISGCFDDLMIRYEEVQEVSELLAYARILIQNVVWAAMNVPWHHDNEALHIEHVVDNAMTVYTRVIYAPLRTEMLMANHNAEVIQRMWRRCITDPGYLACRRRIEFEFREMSRL